MHRTVKRALSGAAVGALLGLVGAAVAAQVSGSGDHRSVTSVSRSTDARRSPEVEGSRWL